MKIFNIIILLIFTTIKLLAQDECFPSPKDHIFIYDEANIFTKNQIQELNSTLNQFTKESSNVFVIITTNNLCDYPIVQYSYEFGDKAKVGRKDFDNGLVITLVPKTTTQKGEVFIAPGRGLEGPIPDAVCDRIINNEMIPLFKKGDYYSGISNGIEVLKKLAIGEFNENDYKNDSGSGGAALVMIIIFFIIFFLIVSISYKQTKYKNYGKDGKNNGVDSFFIFPGFGYRNRDDDDDWFDFGGGGSSGGGGFGGFGGGSFGGGGAGGSW